MNKADYDLIQKKEQLIEERRLAIKEQKNKKSKIHIKMDTIGNIYEYLANPACAISITLAALFSGPIIYVLPTIAAVGAVSATSYKYLLRKKADKINDEIARLKKERQQAYDEREEPYENIFNELQAQGLDVDDYYHKIIKASRDCNKLTESMEPYKQKKKKLEKVRNAVSRIFSYVLVPTGAIILPLVCAFSNMGIAHEVALIGASSAMLFGTSIVDEKLTQKVAELDDVIDDIKSDRTVMYVKRDLKLKDALQFLQKCESRNITRTQIKEKNKNVSKKRKVTNR